MTREEEIRASAAKLEYPFPFDDFFLEGAQWSDNNPSEETIGRIVALYKKWYSEQLDISLTDYIRQQWNR